MSDSDSGQTSWDNLQHHGASWNPGKQLRGGDEAYLHASTQQVSSLGAAFPAQETLGMSGNSSVPGVVVRCGISWVQSQHPRNAGQSL